MPLTYIQVGMLISGYYGKPCILGEHEPLTLSSCVEQRLPDNIWNTQLQDLGLHHPWCTHPVS